MYETDIHESVFRNRGEDLVSRERRVDISHFIDIPCGLSPSRHNGRDMKDQSAVDWMKRGHG